MKQKVYFKNNPLGYLIILAVMIIIISGGLILIREYNANSGNTRSEIISSSLVGLWQDSPMITAGWSDRYHFFPSGEYVFLPSQGDCLTRTVTEKGLWQIKNHQLVLEKKSVTKKVGGQIDKKASPCRNSEQLVNYTEETELMETPSVKSYSLKQCETQEVDYYPCYSIDNIKYYRFDTDPKGVKYKSNELEPEF